MRMRDTFLEVKKKMADSADEQRPLVQQPSGYLRVHRVLSSPRVRGAAVYVLKVFYYFGIIVVIVAICLVVKHYIRANNTTLASLQSTIESLHNIIEILSNKIEAQSAFVKAQQQAILSLLQTVETKFRSHDKNTRELVQKNVERMHQLTDETMKAVQQMTRRQAVAADGALEKKIGKAVIGAGRRMFTQALPWPLNLIGTLVP